MTLPKTKRKEEYDSEPVRYCTQCYSLKIKYEDIIDSDCCMDCGCSDIAETTIDKWEILYEGRYGHKFVQESSNIKESPIFKLSLSKLRTLVYDSPLCRKIIHSIYPRFPGGLNKADSVIVFFDKLIKDNRLDDLRTLLFELKIKIKNGREEKC